MPIRIHTTSLDIFVTSRLALALVGAWLFAAPNAGAAEAVPAKTGSENSVAPATVHAIVRLPAVYVQDGGTEFDGRHAVSFDANRVVFLPQLSGGFGIRPAAGVLIENWLRKFSISATMNLEYSRHNAISYNVDDTWYQHQTTSLYNLGFEIRGYLESGSFKPFVGIMPGYAWLKLPQGTTVTTVDPNTGYRTTSWSDVSLRGLSFEATAGLLYEFIPLILADASFGYRLHGYNSSSAGSLSGLGLTPGWDASLGLVLMY